MSGLREGAGPLEVPIRLLPCEAERGGRARARAEGGATEDVQESPDEAIAALLVEAPLPSRLFAAARAAGIPAQGTRVLFAREEGGGAGAALLLPPEGSPPARTPLAIACRARAEGRLLLPEGTRLEPDPGDRALASLLGEGLALFHARLGLCRALEEEVVPLLSLIRLPPSREAAWEGAREGTSPARRLTAVVPEAPTTLERLLAEGREDIASRPPEEAPWTPRARSGGGAAGEPVGRGGGRGGRGGAGARGGASGAERGSGAAGEGGAGGGRGGEGLLGAAARRLRDALERARDAILRTFWRLRESLPREGAAAGGEALSPRRRDELERLIRLLDRDPDLGLRYALPLGARAGGLPRGVARPSGGLRAHGTDFDLARLRDGGEVEGFSASARVVEELRRRYRDLAAREIALSRHRRAAYILAELLHDLEGAAAALREGRHFREAAALYRDMLRRPEAAAECLEAGGHLAEAAELFVALSRFERAGDLRARLGEGPEAAALYRRAAAACEESRAFLSSARICEVKLKDPERALAALERGSYDPAQTALCLGERFRILGKLARHEQARAEVSALRDERRSPHRPLALVEALGGVGERYPDPEVRSRARDAARVLVGRRAALGAPAAELEGLMAALLRALPEDPILRRDARRFIDGRRREEEEEAARRRREGAPAPRHLEPGRAGPARAGGSRLGVAFRRRIAAEGRVRLLAALRIDASLLALAASGDGLRLLVQRLERWDPPEDRSLALRPRGEVAGRRGEVLLAHARGEERECVLLAFRGGPRVEPVEVVIDPAHPSRALALGTPAWLPEDAVSAASSAGGFLLARADEEDLLLATHDPEGGQVGLARVAGVLGLGAAMARGEPVPILPGPRGTLVGVAGALVLVDDPLGRGDRRILGLPARAERILSAGPHGSGEVIVTHPLGATLLLGKDELRPSALIAPDLEAPLACVTGEGTLVLVSGREARAYALRDGRAHPAGDLAIPEGAAPLALFPHRPAEALLLREDGEVISILAPSA